MGVLNLLKGAYSGKVGQTVGSKWKNLSTIRTFAKPSNPNTPDQQTTRTGFAAVSAFVALFADQVKRFTSLDLRAMSVRNAIMRLNAAQIAAGTLDEATLKINKGGLPNVTTFVPTAPAGLATVVSTWDPATAPSISAEAEVVVVVVSQGTGEAWVDKALNTAGTLTITGVFPASEPLDVYHYVLDSRGSSKVGSSSAYSTITTPSA
jgi:hypothetical protein